jgi:hypothetical protein
MFTTSIKSRVMKAVNQHIDKAQKEYDSGVKEIEQEAKKKKLELADQLVNSILGKFL